MSVQISGIRLSPDALPEELRERALSILKKKNRDVTAFRVVRESVDARKKQVQLVYTVELSLHDETGLPERSDVRRTEPKPPTELPRAAFTSRPVIAGTGPCGLFCALTLARAGVPPLILERGAQVEKRTAAVENYWQGGALSQRTNVQFGEGGAGTFSDGKLTTRIHDPRAERVLADFCRFGADEDILYKAKPHIGTDVLRKVIQNMRAYLISLGCEFRFEAALTDLGVQNGSVQEIVTETGEHIPCKMLILAIGHSARDTYEMLLQKGIAMVQKPFSVGVRIEHLQSDIDRALYGAWAGHPRLGAAPYQLSHRVGEDACYSFCMCPGGIVVAAASETDTIVTNGMSYRARSARNANSALCVNVDRRYFEGDHPLAGVAFQRMLERKAFLLTQGKGAPIQTVGSFLKDGTSRFGRVEPSYTGQTVPMDLHGLFPKGITDMLRTGLLQFDKKIKGFADDDAVLTAPETRTSAPVRILRGDTLESISLGGLYPAGEGAGYAGGIMSAAVDGIRVAEAILQKGDTNE